MEQRRNNFFQSEKSGNSGYELEKGNIIKTLCYTP